MTQINELYKKLVYFEKYRKHIFTENFSKTMKFFIECRD